MRDILGRGKVGDEMIIWTMEWDVAAVRSQPKMPSLA